MLSNAAVLHPADILDLEEEDFDRVVRVNLKGFFLTGQAAAKQMVAQDRGGVIINMSSIPGVHHQREPALLCSVQGRGEAAHGGDGAGARAQGHPRQRHRTRQHRHRHGHAAHIERRSPAHRDVAHADGAGWEPPAEIAAVAAFLASDEASYITGETVVADGGRLGLKLRGAGGGLTVGARRGAAALSGCRGSHETKLNLDSMHFEAS